MRQSKRIKELNAAIQEIKALSEEYRSKNESNKIPVTNKDFNLWIVSQLMEQGNVISALRSKVYILCMIVTGIIIRMLII